MYLPNLKVVALPVPEIIGVVKNFRAVPSYAHIPYSQKSNRPPIETIPLCPLVSRNF